MSISQWTDDFLEQMRNRADDAFDGNIKEVLDIAGREVDYYAKLLVGWLELQQTQIAEVTQIANVTRIAKDTQVAEIDLLRVKQGVQYQELDKLSRHTWPQELQFHIDSARLATLLGFKALAYRNAESALAGMNCALTNAKALKQRIDELGPKPLLPLQAKEPASKDQNLADSPQGRIGRAKLIAYTRFLQITEDIPASPGLFLCEDAYRNAQFKSYPTVLRDTFAPAPCPAWVDEEKLRTGFALWREHMAGCVLVLFTHSLPACYLDAKGIPLLYQTRRLLDPDYLAQRVYETGFFLKDVMDEGGLSVLSDKWAMHTAWLAIAVHQVRPDLKFELDHRLDPYWQDAQDISYVISYGKRTDTNEYKDLPDDDLEAIGKSYVEQMKKHLDKHDVSPDDYSADDLGSESFARLFRNTMQYEAGFRGRRLWGRGVLTATKVRYLHAWMRAMAQHETEFKDSDKSGRPINQEDMVFTLLTIGYVIPSGVEKLGAILSRRQKEAFLHCWKVVGYLMGVENDLLTDDWDEAKALYEQIKRRQMRDSVYGRALTNALCRLIKDLLPAWLPFRSAIAPILIRDQLGADADVLFDAESKAASRKLLPRGCWAFAKHVLIRGYFLSRYWFFDRIPAARAAIDRQMQFLMTGLIESFQQAYDRKKFDLFPAETGSSGKSKVSHAQKERVAHRKRAFSLVTIGMGLILLFHPLFWIGAASLAVSCFSPAAGFGPAAKTLFWWMFWSCFTAGVGMTIVEHRLNACLRKLKYKVHPQ